MLATKTCAVSSVEAGSCTATCRTCQTTVRLACCFWPWIEMCSSHSQKPSRKL